MRQSGREDPSPGRALPLNPSKEHIMFYDTSARHDAQPLFWNLLAAAFQPWQMLARLMAERLDHAILSNLDDHMLKDIGISRGSIRGALRNGRTEP